MTHTRFGLPCFVASAALCIGTLKVWAAHHICSYEGSYGLQGLQVVAAPVRLVPCTRLPLLFLSAQVHPCNRTDIHDQLRCLGVHRGEEMTRRDPCRCQYTGIACPSMRHGGGCDLGQACPFAHNPLEYWLHPSRFRTQLCPDAFACRRAVCFLAHNPEELRLPSEPSLPAGALLHAAAAVAAGTAGAAPPPVPLGLSVAARQRPERAGPAAGSACLPERDARLSADAPSPEEYRRALQQTAALLRRGQQGGAAPAQQKQEGHAPFWLQQPCAAPPLPVEAVCCG
jgi:hypothetical protein